MLLCHDGQAEGRAEGLPSSLKALAESPTQAEVRLSLPANSTEQVPQNQDLVSTSHPASLVFGECPVRLLPSS